MRRGMPPLADLDRRSEVLIGWVQAALISVLGMIWLWRDRPDAANMADHAQATFWFVLPSLPMILAIPAMLRAGVTFWAALIAGSAAD